MKKEITSDSAAIWILEDNRIVTAGTTRRGIEHDFENPYAGFSLCHYTGNLPDNVAECRMQLATFISADINRIIIPRQTHSVNVHTITQTNLTDRFPEDCDALVTCVPDIIIGVNTADCVPVLLYDPENLVVGVAHAGWRGALNGIIENTVMAMESLGAIRSSLSAIICPSIGVECFEVGEEVAQLFPEIFVKRGYGIRPHVDLPGYVQSRLRSSGINDKTITMTGICTRCRNNEYFSARKLGIASGRNFSFIRLNGTPYGTCACCS